MPFQVARICKDFKYCFFASDRQAGRILKLSRSHHWWQARISALSRGSVRRRDWLLRLRSLGDWSRASRCVLTILNLGTVRQIQDTEKRVLSRKTERRGWRKWEGGLAKMWRVWRKCNICGENVKNAGEKKIYYHKCLWMYSTWKIRYCSLAKNTETAVIKIVYYWHYCHYCHYCMVKKH